VGGGLAHGVPATATARKWFTRKAGLAVSVSSVGGGMGLGAIALFSPALLRAYDWSGSWFYLGLVLGAGIMLVAGLVMRKDPESMGLLPDGDLPLPVPPAGEEPIVVSGPPAPTTVWSVGAALRTRTYWYLVVGNALVSVPLMSGLTHMANWGVDICRLTNVPVDRGMETIKIAVALSAVSAVLGALIGGPLSDRIGRKPVFLVSFALYSVALFYSYLVSAVIPSLSGVILSGIAAGFFYGLGMGLWTAYLGDLFGRASLGSLSGLLSFVGGVIGGGGPVIYGLIRDATGSYAPAWGLGTALAVVTMILMAWTRPVTPGARAGAKNL
jgi:MFS family permease